MKFGHQVTLNTSVHITSFKRNIADIKRNEIPKHTTGKDDSNVSKEIIRPPLIQSIKPRDGTLKQTFHYVDSISEYSLQELFDAMGKQLNIQQLEDWYHITKEDLKRVGGQALLQNQFEDSLHTALQHVYPKYEWLPWLFKENVPVGYWLEKQNHRKFFDWLFIKLEFKSMDDWYNITVEQIIQYGGKSLVYNYYKGSPWNALQSVYPEHEWVMWQHKKSTLGFWRDKHNHKLFFDWLGRQLGFKEKDDWYKVTVDQITKYGGMGLLTHYYNHSPYFALKSVYPEHEWIPWKYQRLPRNFWENKQHHKMFFDWMGKQLDIKEMKEWKSVTVNQFEQYGGWKLIQKYYSGSALSALKAVYPQHNW